MRLWIDFCGLMLAAGAAHKLKGIPVEFGSKLGGLHFDVDRVQIYRAFFLLVALSGIFTDVVLRSGQWHQISSLPFYATSVLGLIALLVSFFPSFRDQFDELALVTACGVVLLLSFIAAKINFDSEFSYIAAAICLFIPFLFERIRNLILYTILTALSFYVWVIFVQQSDANLFLFFGFFIFLGTISYFLNRQRILQRNFLKLSNRKINQSASMFDKIFLNSPVGIALVDEELNFQEVNKSFGEKFQIDIDKLQGQSVFEYLEPVEAEKQKEHLLGIFSGKLERHSEERKFKRTDGTPIWMQVALSPVADSTGNVIVALMLVDDITHRKNYEQDLETYSRRLDLETVENKQFSSILDGSVKEPVVEMSQLLFRLQDSLNEDLGVLSQDLLTKVHLRVSRVEEMLAGLAYYSRIEGQSKPSELIDPAVALGMACEIQRDIIEEKEANIIFETFPDILYHEKELAEIFFQLISNALKFSDPDVYPEIKINAVDADRYFIIAIRDNGLGIASADQPAVLELFTKLNRDKGTPGTGIGLPIAKKIVEQNGGTLSLQSSLNGGTVITFSVRKPH